MHLTVSVSQEKESNIVHIESDPDAFIINDIVPKLFAPATIHPINYPKSLFMAELQEQLDWGVRISIRMNDDCIEQTFPGQLRQKENLIAPGGSQLPGKCNPVTPPFHTGTMNAPIG